MANVQGFRQFITAKEEMLDAFDWAKVLSKSHKVQTSHGNVAEAEFRKWLTKFLPKKYAVTSGYIVSTRNSEKDKLIHFDVIIYEHLESPILWVENNPDNSNQGMSLAIPVEYVKGVIEVKSSFCKKTIIDAITHLKELNQFAHSDTLNPHFETLPKTFFSSIVFFEIKEDHKFDEKAVDAIIDSIDLIGFEGGLLLRGDSKEPLLTGRLRPAKSSYFIESTINKPDRCLFTTNAANSKSRKVNESLYYCGQLSWFEFYFAAYAFDIVARMNGTFNPAKLSSRHGFGQSGVL